MGNGFENLTKVSRCGERPIPADIFSHPGLIDGVIAEMRRNARTAESDESRMIAFQPSPEEYAFAESQRAVSLRRRARAASARLFTRER